MAQENLLAMVNTREENEDQSREKQASTSLYHTGQSSEIFATNSSVPASSSPLYYYSARIQSMIQNRSNFTSEVEFDIAYSRDHHWSDLVDSDVDNPATRLANHQHFQVLKNHPQWGGFFMSVKVVVGQKINEGAQAEIYDAKVEFEDGRKSPGYGYHVVKVMKGDCPLQEFQRQWPVGMLCNASKERVKGPLMWILGGTMIGNRFAFVMVRQWGDLRKLIDLKMQQHADLSDLKRQESGDLLPPQMQPRWPVRLFEENFIFQVLLCIARDMDSLHTEYGIVHRDLKASNILLWSLDEGLPCNNPHVKANVVDYECSMGVVGTRFWRAPEILQQLEEGVPRSQIVFTKAADVYSYGMVCYELLSGCIPFESDGHYDFVLDGNRPELSEFFCHNWYFSYIVQSCWKHEPSERPTFSEIVEILENGKRGNLSYLKNNERGQMRYLKMLRENQKAKREQVEAWREQVEAWSEQEAMRKQEEVWREQGEAWREQVDAWREEEAWREQVEAWKEQEEAWRKQEEAWSEQKEAWREQEEAWKELKEVWRKQKEAWKKRKETWGEVVMWIEVEMWTEVEAWREHKEALREVAIWRKQIEALREQVEAWRKQIEAWRKQVEVWREQEEVWREQEEVWRKEQRGLVRAIRDYLTPRWMK